jgi:alkaline phosphatase D
MSISRRDFLSALAIASSAAPTITFARALAPFNGDADRSLFRHGVASGDPLAHRVILWTRITPRDVSKEEIEVEWVVARDPEMRHVVAHDDVSTHAGRDYTVKVDVEDLEPGTTYYYRFRVGGVHSPLGRTRTLPVGRVDRLRLAVTSCSNYPYGFFNVYGLIGQQADLDAVLHLGDYLYEYANGEYGNGAALNRLPEPPKEIVALQDYRTRHALYKTDPDLQEAHRQHPFITVWDDHETANNSWKGGAENHQPATEGDWQARKAAALRAYFEWMPIRENRFQTEQLKAGLTPPIYRSFRFGQLAELSMLDTRLIGRDQQAANPLDVATINNPSRQLLGAEQEKWLFTRLSRSTEQRVQWRVIGQQIMMAQLSLDRGRSIANEDQWDGYKPARDRLFNHIRTNNIGNVIVLSGDIHSSWANDLTPNPFDTSYNATTGAGSLGVEFVTPGVTSPFLFPDTPVGQAQAAGTAAQIRSISPHIQSAELFRRGYLLLDIDRDRVQSEWYYPKTIQQRFLQQDAGAILYSASGSNHLLATTLTSAPRRDSAPLAN